MARFKLSMKQSATFRSDDRTYGTESLWLVSVVRAGDDDQWPRVDQLPHSAVQTRLCSPWRRKPEAR